MQKQGRKIKAWLVTWEWNGEHAKRDDKVAAVLNARLSGENVQKFVELLYLADSSTVSERMDWASGRNIPYPAKFVDKNGVPLFEEIHCGHNPFLFARKVDDLAVENDADGKESATWKERRQ